MGAYLEWLRAWAKDHSDGCTKSLDIHVHCCWQHDYVYQTGLDPRQAFLGNAVPLSRRDADALLRDCMIAESPFGRFSIRAWYMWAGVRIFGRWFKSSKLT